MPVKCRSGKKPRWKWRKVGVAKRRTAYCNGMVVESKEIR